jgi:hypothetical protein
MVALYFAIANSHRAVVIADGDLFPAAVSIPPRHGGLDLESTGHPTHRRLGWRP